MAGIFGLLMSGAGVIKDQYYNLTSLLLPGNGTNGAQNNTFLDSSSNTFTITRNGNTTQGTFSPFSQTGWGGSFSGSNQLTLPSALALAPEAGQFCIEFWIYPTASWGSVDRPIFVAAGSGGLWVGWQATAFVLRAYGVTNHLTYATAPTLNTWTHVAICRNSGNTTSMYFNGSRVATGTVTQNFAQAISYIGSDTAYGGGGAALLMASNLSNLRLVKGSSVYDPTQTSITVPTSPLTAVTNTTLLICQSNRFVDNSTANSGSGWTVTSNGNVTITPFSPFAPTQSYSAAAVGGSGYFDGTGDYLSVADNTALDMEASDFTMECWVYLNETPSSSDGIFAKRTDVGTFGGVLIYFSGLTPNFYATLSGSSWGIAFSSSIAATLNAWTHLAFTRSGSTWTIYVNGVSGGTGNSSGTVPNNTSAFVVGAYSSDGNATYLFPAGYISNVRVVKGTAIVPPAGGPTAPLTAVPNTSLLLNFTNAGVVDATAKNVLETVGNAQISTGAAKFGTTSIYCDGNGDQLVFPSSPLHAFGTGDFTIEFWAYSLDSGSSLRGIIDTRPASAGPNGILLRENSGGFLVLTSNTNPVLTTTTGRTANVWQHIALVRASGTFRLYVDALFQTSATPASNDLNSQNLKISGFVDTAASPYAYYGYLSNFRITKFARYSGTSTSTANFTLPTAPFPVQ